MLTRRGKDQLQRLRILAINGKLLQRDPTAEQHLVPWDGVSPRDLTGQPKGFSLEHEGASLIDEDAQIEEQCRRHLNGW